MIFYRFTIQIEIFLLHQGDYHWLVPAYQTQAYSARSFSVVAPTLWNSLPLNIKNAQSLSTFKKRLKTFFLSNFTRNFITLFFPLCILFISYICNLCIFHIFYFLYLLSALSLCSCALKELYYCYFYYCTCLQILPAYQHHVFSLLK